MTPTTPAELTATVGVKAGRPVTVLITFGAVHVLPPSVEVVLTIWLTVPVNRLSDQTTYSCPVLGSIAAEGRPSPVRRAAPVFGSVSVTNCWAATVVGPDQVVPPSDEETKPTL